VLFVCHTVVKRDQYKPLCELALFTAEMRIVRWKKRRRRFRIDTEVRCVGAHPPFWPLEPMRVKPN